MILGKIPNWLIKQLSFQMYASLVLYLVLTIFLDEVDMVTEDEPGKFEPVLPIPNHFPFKRIKSDFDSNYEKDKCLILSQKPSKASANLASATLMDLLNDGSQSTTNYGDFKDSILIMGNKGSGINTLTRIISGNVSGLNVGYTHARNSRLVIIDADRNSGGGAFPKALVPEAVLSLDVTNGKDSLFFSCPGFDDARIPEQKLAIDYFMKQLLKKVSRLKILFLVNHNSIRSVDDNQDFGLLVSHATRFLGTIQSYSMAIGLVATNVSSFDEDRNFIPDEVILNGTVKFLKNYLDDIKFQLDSSLIPTANLQRKLKFVEALLKQNRQQKYGQISFSRSPTECGTLGDSKEVSDSRERITLLYSEELEYAPVSSNDFGNIYQSNLSMTDIISLNAEVTKGVQLLMNDFRIWLNIDFMNATNVKNKATTLEWVLVALQEIQTMWNSLQNQFNPDNILAIVEPPLRKLGYNISKQDRNVFTRLNSYFTFLDDVNEASVPRSVEDWKMPIVEMITTMSHLPEKIPIQSMAEHREDNNGILEQLQGLKYQLEIQQHEIELLRVNIERQANATQRLEEEHKNVNQLKSDKSNNFHGNLNGQVKLLKNVTTGVLAFKLKLDSCRRQVVALRNRTEINQSVLKRKSSEITVLQLDKNELKILTEDREKGVTWLKANSHITNYTSELFLAVNEKHEGALHLLVDLGADINIRDNLSLATPLTRAAVGGDKSVCLRMIKYLIGKGANVYARDNESRTFLHELVSDDTSLNNLQFHDIVQYLISKNLTTLFNMPFASGNLVVPVAVRNIEVELRTLTLLQKNGIDLNVINQKGNTILIYPLQGKRSTKLLTDLIALGINWRHLNNSNQTLVHSAAEFCYVDGVKYFLKLGLDVNSLDNYGDTPLHRTLWYGSEDILETVKILLDNGADVTISDEGGHTPLDVLNSRKDIRDEYKVKLIELLNGNT